MFDLQTEALKTLVIHTKNLYIYTSTTTSTKNPDSFYYQFKRDSDFKLVALTIDEMFITGYVYLLSVFLYTVLVCVVCINQ